MFQSTHEKILIFVHFPSEIPIIKQKRQTEIIILLISAKFVYYLYLEKKCFSQKVIRFVNFPSEINEVLFN